MACMSRSCMVLLAGAASAFPVYDVGEGDAVAVNMGGTAFISVDALDSTRAIECYTDYGTGGGSGTCKVLITSGETVTVESGFVFAPNETHGVKVAAFSPSQAVVCFVDKGVTGLLNCKSLAIEAGTNEISGTGSVVIDTDAFEVPHLDVASLSHEVGALCWSMPDPENVVKDRAGVCNKLTLDTDTGAIAVGNKSYFDTAHSTTDVSVRRFSPTSAAVCWGAQGTGLCRVLALNGSGGDDFSRGTEEVFYTKATGPDAQVEFEGLVVVRFTETRGMVCYAEKVAQNTVACKVLALNGSTLVVGEEVVVNSNPSTWLTAVEMTEEAALVCYATNPDGAVINTDSFDGAGTCNIVGLTDGSTTIGVGPPNEVNEEATQHMSVALLDVVQRSAVLCYSDKGAGGGNCKALSMAETTTSTTETSTTSLSSATVSTTSLSSTTVSTTTPHTTTETSTSTESSTTSFHTTTATQTTATETTTSPHTTTITLSTTTSEQGLRQGDTETVTSSGSVVFATLSASAVFAAALSCVAL